MGILKLILQEKKDNSLLKRAIQLKTNDPAAEEKKKTVPPKVSQMLKKV